MDGHNKNSNHQAFKDPFPPHEKGESYRSKKSNAKVNFTYTNNDNIINMIEAIDHEYCNAITIKGKGEITKSKTPFVQRGSVPQSTKLKPPQISINAIT